MLWRIKGTPTTNDMEFRQVVVAGVGGVGWPLVVSLCQVLDGSVPVIIYDDDNFEGGRGYTRFPHIFDTKKFKANWLREHIEAVWRKRPPLVFPKKLEVKDFKGKDWKGILFVDCTDMDPKKRKQLHDAALASGATYMRVSYDGKVANVARGLPMLSKEAREGAGGYIEPPDLPMSFAAGGWGAKFVLHALETGEVEEGVLRVPIQLIMEGVKDVAETAGRELSNSKEDAGRGVDGALGDSGDNGGIDRRVRVDGPLPGRKGRKKSGDKG